MKLYRLRIATCTLLLALILPATELTAQQDLLAACYEKANLANSQIELNWADLEACNTIIDQSEDNELADYQRLSALLNRAILLTELTEYSRARADLESARLIDSESEALYLNLGILSMVQGDYLLATEEFSQALEIEPYSALPLYNRALAYSYLEDLSSAVNDLLVLQVEHPQEYLAWVDDVSMPTLSPLMPALVIPIQPLINTLEKLPEVEAIPLQDLEEKR